MDLIRISILLKVITKMLLKVDLQCHRCYKKVKKVLCKFPRESLSFPLSVVFFFFFFCVLLCVCVCECSCNLTWLPINQQSQKEKGLSFYVVLTSVNDRNT
jgi:hypothetical protein